MRSLKAWLFGTFLLASLGGAVLLGTPSSQAQTREDRNYWRHHDGRWSHWDARDKQWYYTDGTHWYNHNGKGWQLYRFDKTFGREGFERGGYVPPGPDARVVVPNHAIYVAPLERPGRRADGDSMEMRTRPADMVRGVFYLVLGSSR